MAAKPTAMTRSKALNIFVNFCERPGTKKSKRAITKDPPADLSHSERPKGVS